MTGREATVEFREEHHRNVDDGYIVEVSLRHRRSSRCAASGAVRRTEPPWMRSSIAWNAGPSSTSSGRAIGLAQARTPVSAAGRCRRSGSGDRPTTWDPRAVVKVKRFAIEPMFEEDAVSRMEELGHAFFIFVNAENERWRVLYRRRDGRYGLIEPVIGGSYARRLSRRLSMPADGEPGPTTVPGTNGPFRRRVSTATMDSRRCGSWQHRGRPRAPDTTV